MPDKRVIASFLIVLTIHLLIGGVLYASYRAANQPAMPSTASSEATDEAEAAPRQPPAETPPRQTTTAPPTDLQYTVERGDTYWEIARQHRISVRELMQYNGHGEDYVLKVGDRLRIPAPGSR